MKQIPKYTSISAILCAIFLWSNCFPKPHSNDPVTTLSGLLLAGGAHRYLRVLHVPSGTVTYTLAVNQTTGALSTMYQSTTGPASKVLGDPLGRFAYLVSSPIGSYSFNRSTGGLTALGSIGSSINDLAIDSAGQFVYSTQASGFVQTYSPTALSGGLLQTSSTITNSNPVCVIAHPNGSFVYVLNQGANAVSSYTNSNGVLYSSGAVFFAGAGTRLAVDPFGRYLYVLTTSSIISYSINPLSGTLTVVSTTVLANTSSIAVDSTGQRLFVTQGAISNLATFSLSSGGLSSSGNVAMPVGANQMVMDQDGRFGYVLSNTGITVMNLAANGFPTVTGTFTLTGSSISGSYY